MRRYVPFVPFVALGFVIVLSSCGGGGGSGGDSSSGGGGTTVYTASSVAATGAANMGSDAIVGALLANDNGYSVRQIAAALSGGSLGVNGSVSGVSPTYTPPNTLSAYIQQNLGGRSSPANAFTDEEVAIIRGVVEIYILIQQQETDDILTSVLLSMGQGFLADQVVQAIVENYDVDDTGNIAGQTPNGTVQTDVFTETGGSSGGTDGGGTDTGSISYPITYSGSASYTSSATVTFGGGASIDCQSFGDISITLYADGSLKMVFDTNKAATFDTKGNMQCTDSPYTNTRTRGSHANGEYRVEMYSDPSYMDGTYNAYGIQGSWSYSGTLTYSSGDAATVTESLSFNIATAR